ncbi:VOC family protein [Synechococcales cyanobacterium C]|uniref:VOC family protein n=1 Tax=Petrachloros mirabilis ULC683 TaxID=2781853 RepID=A0A8K2A8D3_9CYAN|nr:VOC family protein [Petrachloros mirabilis]NCJ07894.1 VOC family protein [Petrachloros mirabilis ULC683]
MSQGQNRVHEVFPYLRVKGAPAAIDFYKNVFGATERFRLTEPSGRIGHIELDLGNIILMLSEEFPEYGCFAPQATGSTGMAIHLHCDNADELAARAVSAGATLVRDLSDAFYGERSCVIRDPFGHEWMLGHEIEPVSPDEMQRRYTAMFN